MMGVEHRDTWKWQEFAKKYLTMFESVCLLLIPEKWPFSLFLVT